MTSPRGSGQAGVAGTILVVLGALWALVGTALLAVAQLASGAGALPDRVSGLPAAGSSSLLMALVGVLVVAAGVVQVLIGVAMARGRVGTRVLVGGLLLAAVGAGVAAVWLFNAVAQQRPAWILLLPLAAYLYAGWVLAFRTDWFRID